LEKVTKKDKMNGRGRNSLKGKSSGSNRKNKTNKKGRGLKRKSKKGDGQKRKAKEGKRKGNKQKNIGRKSGSAKFKNSSKKRCGYQMRQSSFCPAEKAQVLNLLYNKVTNFFKQLKRAENWGKIVSKKKAKKDDFVNDAAILEDAVGGNFSDATCSSRKRAASTAKEKGELLKNCSNSISENCPDITIDSSVSGDCNSKMKEFETKVTTCKSDDSCTCWTDALAMKSDLSSCSAVDELNRVQGLKDKCVSQFGECKKAQDSAVELTATCPAPSGTTPTMTTMPSKRRRILADILAKNVMKKYFVDF